MIDIVGLDTKALEDGYLKEVFTYLELVMIQT